MVAIVIVAILAYFMFFNGAPAPSGSSLLQSGPSGEVIGAQVLSLLNQIQSLRIDSSLFENAAYKSFQDYTVAIPPQNVGRDNPFAPIPGFTAPSPSH